MPNQDTTFKTDPEEVKEEQQDHGEQPSAGQATCPPAPAVGAPPVNFGVKKEPLDHPVIIAEPVTVDGATGAARAHFEPRPDAQIF